MLLTLISHSSDLILHASSTTSTFTTSVPVFDRPQSQHPKMAKHSDWWKASQLEKKRNARRDLCQEWGYDADAHWQKDAEQTRVEHQWRPKRDIEKECASTRSMSLCPLNVSHSTHIHLSDFSSRRRTCPKTIRLERDIQLQHLRNSKSLSIGSLSLQRTDLLLMNDQPCTQF